MGKEMIAACGLGSLWGSLENGMDLTQAAGPQAAKCPTKRALPPWGRWPRPVQDLSWGQLEDRLDRDAPSP